MQPQAFLNLTALFTMVIYREPSATTVTRNEPTRQPSTSQDRHHVRPINNLHRNQYFGSSARGTYTSGRRDLDGMSSIQGVETPGAERLGWIDEEYFERNPWHNQGKKKPVFSLGGTLPRVVRGPRKPKQTQTRANEDLAERGEVDGETGEPQPAHRSQTHESSQDPPATHTAAGTAHNDKRNYAGQPVFDYTPGQPDSHQPQDQTQEQTPTDSDDGGSPDYKIDGEPLGKREADEVEEDEDPNEYRNWWARMRAKHPEPLAEFLAVSLPRTLQYSFRRNRLTSL